MNSVWCILYNAYEFDDIYQGDLTPRYISLNKEDAINQFNKWKSEQISLLNNVCENHKDMVNSRPEDFQIYIDEENELEVWIDNWCYHYKLIEFKLNVDLNWVD